MSQNSLHRNKKTNPGGAVLLGLCALVLGGADLGGVCVCGGGGGGVCGGGGACGGGGGVCRGGGYLMGGGCLGGVFRGAECDHLYLRGVSGDPTFRPSCLFT